MKTPLVFALLVTCAACGRPAPPRDESPLAPVATAGAAATSNAVASASTEPAPSERIAIAGDPNGLAWDDASHSLFIADNANDAILRLRDGKIAVHAKLPEPHAGLGAIALGAGGVIAAVRFGRGGDGGVVVIDPDGKTTPVAGLDPKRRRLGLFIDKRPGETALYVTYFSAHGKSGEGGVERLSLVTPNASVHDAVISLDKPVGVAVSGEQLFVTDQGKGLLLRASLADPQNLSPVAQIEAPDLFVVAPGETIFVTSKGGVVRQIGAHGEVKAIGRVRHQARGVAYDASTRRLFVSDHDPEGKDSAIDVFTPP